MNMDINENENENMTFNNTWRDSQSYILTFYPIYWNIAIKGMLFVFSISVFFPAMFVRKIHTKTINNR